MWIREINSTSSAITGKAKRGTKVCFCQNTIRMAPCCFIEKIRHGSDLNKWAFRDVHGAYIDSPSFALLVTILKRNVLEYVPTYSHSQTIIYVPDASTELDSELSILWVESFVLSKKTFYDANWL